MYVIAFDLGASNGRAILGSYDGQTLGMEELLRFDYPPLRTPQGMRWNIPVILDNIKEGLRIAASRGIPVTSVAVDTWGVDYGLLDRQGELTELPFHYRDSRTDGWVERIEKQISYEEMYAQTGIQVMQINTLYQLCVSQLEGAQVMLLTPDLINYLLTGTKQSEYSIASTTQLLYPDRPEWNISLIRRLGLPEGLFTPIVQAGTVIGSLTADITAQTGANCSVTAVASHDTASAVVAIPAQGTDYVFISCGTWSLIGVEEDMPNLSDAARAFGCSNEKGAFGKTLFIRNMMGLWLLQECRRIWKQEGSDYSYAELAQMADAADWQGGWIDPDDVLFLAPDNMPAAIQEFCSRTHQAIPQMHGEIVGCLLKSMALKYRYTIERLERILGRKLPVIHMIGGGVRNTTLCRYTADCTGRTVITGPEEATAMGNILVQLYAQGTLGSLDALRGVARKTTSPVTYQPGEKGCWDTSYTAYIKNCLNEVLG